MTLRGTLTLGAVAVMAVALATPAHAISTLSAQWYTLSSANPDTEKTVDGVTTGLVLSNLGPNGLPVRSPASLGYPASSSNNITDVNAITNEIQWWTPHATVSVDPFYPTTVSIPYSVPSNLFPGGAGSNGGDIGYTSAHLFGTFSIPTSGSVTLNLGSDDDAWVFIDGVLVVDNGGVHGLATTPTLTSPLSAGTHKIDVFFTDRHEVQSGLEFSADVTFQPIPEPISLAMLGSGLLGLGLLRRRAAR